MKEAPKYQPANRKVKCASEVKPGANIRIFFDHGQGPVSGIVEEVLENKDQARNPTIVVCCGGEKIMHLGGGTAVEVIAIPK